MLFALLSDKVLQSVDVKAPEPSKTKGWINLPTSTASTHGVWTAVAGKTAERCNGEVTPICGRWMWKIVEE